VPPISRAVVALNTVVVVADAGGVTTAGTAWGSSCSHTPLMVPGSENVNSRSPPEVAPASPRMNPGTDASPSNVGEGSRPFCSSGQVTTATSPDSRRPAGAAASSHRPLTPSAPPVASGMVCADDGVSKVAPALVPTSVSPLTPMDASTA
jgi:hypothetical protein